MLGFIEFSILVIVISICLTLLTWRTEVIGHSLYNFPCLFVVKDLFFFLQVHFDEFYPFYLSLLWVF